MAHGQPQRGEVPFPACSSPPLSRPLAREGPSYLGRAGHHPSWLPWLARGAGAEAGVLHQPTRELRALLWLLPVRPGRLCGLRSQVRGWHSGTSPHSEIEASAHGDTHGQAHMHSDRQAQAYTETQPSTPRHTRPAHRQTLWRARKLTSAKSPCPTQRQTQKQKGMGTRRSKQHTNARLEASRAPHPGTVIPISQLGKPKLTAMKQPAPGDMAGGRAEGPQTRLCLITRLTWNRHLGIQTRKPRPEGRAAFSSRSQCPERREGRSRTTQGGVHAEWNPDGFFLAGDADNTPLLCY
ncbi:uncharacterized protein WM277_013685 isoform 2-T2 [Molossus nigricans]